MPGEGKCVHIVPIPWRPVTRTMSASVATVLWPVASGEKPCGNAQVQVGDEQAFLSVGLIAQQRAVRRRDGGT